MALPLAGPFRHGGDGNETDHSPATCEPSAGILGMALLIVKHLHGSDVYLPYLSYASRNHGWNFTGHSWNRG